MEENKKEPRGSFSSLKGTKRFIPLFLIALAAFLTFCFMTNGMGLVGDAIAKFLLGAFSWGAYFIPAFIAIHAILFASDVHKGRILSRSIFSLVTLIAISSIIHAASYSEITYSASAFYNEGMAKVGGGFVGGSVAFLLAQLFGRPGVIIISILIFILYVTYYFSSGRSSLSKALLTVLDFISDIFTVIGKRRRKKQEEKQKKAEEELNEKRAEESDSLLNDEFFMPPGVMKEVRLSDLTANGSSGDRVRSTTTFTSESARVSVDVSEYVALAKNPQPRKRLSLDYGENNSDFAVNDRLEVDVFDTSDIDIIYEDKTNVADTDNDTMKAERAMYGLDENAEDVFTSDFSAYDFKLNQEIASKKSSKAAQLDRKEPEGIDEFSEPLIHASEEAIEKARQRADFEMRKRAVIDARKRMDENAKVSKILTENGTAPVRQIIDDSPVSMQFDDSAAPKEPEKSAATDSFTRYLEEEEKNTPATTIAEDTFEFGKRPETPSADIEKILRDSFPTVDNTPTPPTSFDFGENTSKETSHTVDTPFTSKSPYAEPTTSVSDVNHTQSEPSVNEEVYTKSTPSVSDVNYRQSEPSVDEEVYTKSTPSVSEASYTESVPSTSEEACPESIPSISESTSEKASYSFESQAENEEKSAQTVIKSFKVADPEVPSFDNAGVEDSSLRLSRSMLDPEPTITERIYSSESDAPPYNGTEQTPKAVDERKEEILTTQAEEGVVEEPVDLKGQQTLAADEQPSGLRFDFDGEMPEPEEEEPVSRYADKPEEEDSVYEEIPEQEQNEDVKNYRNMYNFLKEEDNKEATVNTASSTPVKSDESDSLPWEDEKPHGNTASRPAQAQPTVTSEKATRTPQENDTAKKPDASAADAPVEDEPIFTKPDYSDYQFPPISLLLEGKTEEDPNLKDELNKNAEKLVGAIGQYGIKVSLKGIDHGPRITRYEIVPALGVRVSQITNLSDDIALNMAADGIRMEAPIPGKSAIGVEIPNKHPSLVRLRDLIETEEFESAQEKTTACLGKDVTGTPVFFDIAKMPHMLIAGATGMGKSVCINAILLSILYKARPDEVKFIMIDPKKVEFNGYNGIPHLLVPVVTDVKQAAGALTWAVEQMEKRYDLMGKLEVRQLDSYNEKVKEDPSLGEPLPKIIIIIDELNDIMLQVKKPAEELITSIAQKARAAGIHLILGTQRPSVDVITGVIKANIPSRIACKVTSNTDSRTILDQAGAERLLKNGDMLYFPAGAPKAQRVQGAFVSDGEISSVMKFLKSQAKGPVYDKSVLDDINRAAQKCTKGKGGSDDSSDDDDDDIAYLSDPQFLAAAQLAIKQGKIATSLIQRKLSVGYSRAAKFIDCMEDLGLVSEPNGQRPRDVLLSADEWNEMLARRSLD